MFLTHTLQLKLMSVGVLSSPLRYVHVSVVPYVTLLYSVCVYVTYMCTWFSDVWTKL